MRMWSVYISGTCDCTFDNFKDAVMYFVDLSCIHDNLLLTMCNVCTLEKKCLNIIVHPGCTIVVLQEFLEYYSLEIDSLTIPTVYLNIDFQRSVKHIIILVDQEEIISLQEFKKRIQHQLNYLQSDKIILKYKIKSLFLENFIKIPKVVHEPDCDCTDIPAFEQFAPQFLN